MSETFNITFQGGSAVSEVINTIHDNIEDLETQVFKDEMERRVPELIITSSGAEQAVEDFLVDVLEEVQIKAVENEGDFTAHV